MAVDVTPTPHAPRAPQEARPAPAERDASEPHDAPEVHQTTCCIVGGGPAGALLALLLARHDIPVLLLEQHLDFDRDFRGDSVHPSTMEIMDQLGLADRLLQLPHSKLRTVSVMTVDGPYSPVRLDHLRTKYPYVTMMPQARFLEFIVGEARRYPSFQVVMGAAVQELVVENWTVKGARYRTREGWHEVRAALTVGADGRFSRVRQLAGIEPEKTSPPMDILWFRVPRRPEDPPGAAGRIGKGHMVAMLDRGDEWQVAYVIPKGTYQQIHADGIAALRASIAEIVPEMAERFEALHEWKDVSLLSVESSQCPTWYRPGLLLIGDAAHVMSPVGGVGINFAVADAVAAANILAEPLKQGRVTERHLAAFQRRRQWPAKVMQRIQTAIQNGVVKGALASQGPVHIPPLARFLFALPVIGDLPARLMAFGIRHERVED